MRSIAPTITALLITLGLQAATSFAANEPDLAAVRNQLVAASTEENRAKVVKPEHEDLKAKEAALIARLETSNADAPNGDGDLVPFSETDNKRSNRPSQSDSTSAATAVNKVDPVAELKSNVERSAAEVAKLKGDVSKKEKETKDLRGELAKVRNQLTIAEMQVERLSQIVESQNRKALGVYTPDKAQPASVQKTSTKTHSPGASRTVTFIETKPKGRSAEPASSVPDVQILTVVADKANLRAGPGETNSVLMTVSRGTRLAVETKQGDWYRVTSPTGTHVWVSRDVIAFGPDALSRPTTTLRLQGLGQ